MGEPAIKLEPTSRFAAYLEAERSTGLKHEYHDGKIVAMAGGSGKHSLIASRINYELTGRLEGQPCQPHNSDLRIRTGDSNFYPDVVVVCPPIELDKELPHTLLNPRVIVEVLSPSTESYDRGFKWFHYQQIESLTDYVLVASESKTVEHYHRESDATWLYELLGENDTLKLPSINCEVPVAAFYKTAGMWD